MNFSAKITFFFIFKSKRRKNLALQNILCTFAAIYVTKTD